MLKTHSFFQQIHTNLTTNHQNVTETGLGSESPSLPLQKFLCLRRYLRQKSAVSLQRHLRKSPETLLRGTTGKCYLQTAFPNQIGNARNSSEIARHCSLCSFRGAVLN